MRLPYILEARFDDDKGEVGSRMSSSGLWSVSRKSILIGPLLVKSSSGSSGLGAGVGLKWYSTTEPLQRSNPLVVDDYIETKMHGGADV